MTEVRFLGHATTTRFPPIETDAQAFKSDVESATGSNVVALDPGEAHAT